MHRHTIGARLDDGQKMPRSRGARAGPKCGARRAPMASQLDRVDRFRAEVTSGRKAASLEPGDQGGSGPHFKRIAAAALEELFGGGVRIVVIAEFADPDGVDAALITQAIEPIRFHHTTLWRNKLGLFLPISIVTADGSQTARMRARRAVDFKWRDRGFFGGAGSPPQRQVPSAGVIGVRFPPEPVPADR